MSDKTLKLYKVTCRGMHGGLASNMAHGVAYVVATDTAKAYGLVRNHLEAKDLGFARDRELESVELIAEDYDYASCGFRLFLPQPTSRRDAELGKG